MITMSYLFLVINDIPKQVRKLLMQTLKKQYT